MRWRSQFQLKDLLSPEDVPPAQAQRAGKEVARRLRSSPEFRGRTGDSLAHRFEEIRDQNEFNITLDELYDIADEEGIWVY
jgi:hypothetical protein